MTNNFKEFANDFVNHVTLLDTNCENLFVVDVDIEVLWNKYLDEFPIGTNAVFKENREHDCNCCHNFIRDIGNVVGIIDGEIVSVWDLSTIYPYNIVSKKLSKLVKRHLIETIFLSELVSVGKTNNIKMYGDIPITHSHFHLDIPSKYQSEEIGTKRNKVESAVHVFKRGLDEFTIDAFEVAIDLIEENQIERATEDHLEQLKGFLNYLIDYNKIESIQDKNIFVWDNFHNLSVSQLRSSSIGTLIQDLSEDKDLDVSVRSFESKISAGNYQRPTALIISKKMKESALERINELGINDSIIRRYATPEDINKSDILFADNKISKVMKGSLESILDMAVSEKPNAKSEMTIHEFMSDILPYLKSLKLFVTGEHESNLMSITGPKYPDTKNIFKWSNKFAWSYNKDLTDSIKTRVKNAGGSIDALIRISLGWNVLDDYDIHMIAPGNNHIHYGNKQGILDIDMNVADTESVRGAVENMILNNPKIGEYKIYIENYTYREPIGGGFTVETEYKGKIEHYSYNRMLKHKEKVYVLNFIYDGNDFKISKVYDNIETGILPKNTWGITTEKYIDVNMVMLSPNFWNSQTIGHKHWFFILNNCINPDKARGFYNEYLMGELHQDRKVFEYLGSMIKCEHSDNQLSGIGFSSTKKDKITVNADGRIITINF